MGRAVIVAECNQRTNFQPQVLRYLRTIVLPHFIMNHRAVFAVNHEHGLLHLDAFYFISKDWKRVEAKLFPSIHNVSSSLERRTNRPTGGLVAATRSPW